MASNGSNDTGNDDTGSGAVATVVGARLRRLHRRLAAMVAGEAGMSTAEYATVRPMHPRARSFYQAKQG